MVGALWHHPFSTLKCYLIVHICTPDPMHYSIWDYKCISLCLTMVPGKNQCIMRNMQYNVMHYEIADCIYSIKYKMTTMTIIVIVVVIVPCPSSLSWSLVIGLHHLCPFVGAGHRLWAVVGGGCGPWFVFWGWQPFLCWLSFVFVLGGLSSFLGSREQSSAMVVHWHWHGGRAVVGCHWGHHWCHPWL